MKINRTARRILALCVVGALAAGMVLYVRGHRRKSWYQGPCARSDWSIGIYAGKDPLHMSVLDGRDAPLLTPAQVSDRSARAVADPFLIHGGDRWHLFFEVINRGSEHGAIGYASSLDARAWRYEKIVIDEDFHMSYPYVFTHGGEYFMVPETRATQSIRLYKAERFPDKWRFERELIRGNYSDPSIVEYGGRWWIFACRNPYSLHVYYADSLYGPWRPHAENPIHWRDKSLSRPGGRLVVSDGTLIRYAQDNRGGYGHQLRAFVVDTLTPDEYAEHEAETSPVLQPAGDGWRARAMHTMAPWPLADGSWLASVDAAGCPP